MEIDLEAQPSVELHKLEEECHETEEIFVLCVLLPFLHQ